MVSEVTLIVRQASDLRQTIIKAGHMAKACLDSGSPAEVVVRPRKSKRTSEQNKRLNAMCGDLAEQVMWHGQALHRDDWRHMFVAAYRKEQKIVPGLNGGFVVLGASSRRLTVGECSDVIEMLYAFGAENNVVWSEPE